MTTDTDLRAAVAHSQELVSRGDAEDQGGLFWALSVDDISLILNAVASGHLVLKADVDGLVGALDFAVVNSRIYGVTPDSKGRQVWHDNAVGSVARAALTTWENRK